MDVFIRRDLSMDSVSKFKSDEMNKHRVTRGSKFVVHVEALDDDCTRFEELDAEDVGHAYKLAHEWVNGALGRAINAQSAAVRRVLYDGTLMSPILYVNVGG